MVEIYKSLGADAFQREFSDSPKILAFLEANFGGEDNERLCKQLIEAADESVFSLRQWVEALRTLQSWLDTRALDLQVEDQIAYVCCSGEAAASSSGLASLPGLVSDFLESYGCERAVQK